MSDCLFCNIINKQLPSKTVYEDDEFVAFEDIHPKAPVHVLVVPKKHIKWVNDLRDEDKELAGKWLLTARAVADKVGIGEGYKLQISVGGKGGQEVWHLHMHILGGWDKPQTD